MTLELAAKDFGPVATGRIKLSPLTVFVGPNNSGKSVLAMLMYAATRAAMPYRGYFYVGGHRRILSATTYRMAMPYLRSQAPPDEVARDFIIRLIDNPRLRADAISPEITSYLRGIVEHAVKQYGEDVRSEIARSFGAPLPDLRRSAARGRRRRLVVTITSQHPRWRLQVSSSRPFTEFDVSRVDIPSLVRLTRTQFASEFEGPWLRQAGGEFALREISALFLAACFNAFPSVSYYLPAARSGFLQSHRAIASSVVSRAPYAGIEDMRIPKMSGVIADFISHLLDMPPEPANAQVNEVAQFLEGALAGSIRVEAKPEAYPEFWYESQQGRFPLHRTSSMVSELAPIVLYIRHLLDPDELLIIEEPESHLHPASQLILARALSRLVKLGVRTLITTHSDYFLAQLNNLIRAAQVPRAVHERADIAVLDVIDASSVGAYSFNARGNAGTSVHPIAVDPKQGISDDEFASVAEPLYSQRLVLERQMPTA